MDVPSQNDSVSQTQGMTMAAQLDYDLSGKANMAYFGETPWHGEGVELNVHERFDFDGVMERHFSYPLEKLPYFFPVTTENGTEYHPAPDQFYIFRRDKGLVLGSVGTQYKLISNAEAFEVLKPLIDQKIAAIETGGSLRDGADAWLMVKWDMEKFDAETKEIFSKDGGIQPYSTVMANHTSRRPLLLGNTPIRIVCANTLGMAEHDAKNSVNRWESIKHNRFAKTRLVEAAERLFYGVTERYKVIAQQYRRLMNTALEERMWETMVLDVVAPDPSKDEKWNPEARFAETVMERCERKRKLLNELWLYGKGHTGEKTAWYAYQAVVEALDYNEALFPHRGGCPRSASLLDGPLAEMKNTVLDNLMSISA